MTIASEISRLQTDKECIRQAIIWKWVDVSSSLTFDSYAACIDAIEQGWWDTFAKALWVWWWWGWANWYNWWWWGWGDVLDAIISVSSEMCIIIWAWWGVASDWWDTKIWGLTVKWWKSGNRAR